jgi:hypothetical protein
VTGYVVAAYGMTIALLGGYALWVWLRLRAQAGATEEPPVEPAAAEAVRSPVAPDELAR